MLRHFQTLFILLFSISSLTFPLDSLAAGDTVIYKVTHPDGSVTYSDQALENAERMTVRPVDTVPAFDVKNSPELDKQLEPENNDAAYYTQLDIQSPEAGSAFYSGSGDVNVLVKVNPPLKRQHTLRLSMDGKTVATNQSGSFVLSTVDRGTHSLKISILDGRQNVIKSTQSSFTLHRPSVLNP